jgi:hypothetical protein
MFQRLSQGDNTNRIYVPEYEGYRDNSIPQHPNTSPPIFAILNTFIQNLPQRALKYLPSVVKVKPVFKDVLLVFVVVPFKVPFRVHGKSLVDADSQANLCRLEAKSWT